MEDGAAVLGEGGNQHMDLPPGFRFHPTDEELITHYLSNKVTDASFHAVAIGEVDLNKCEPWDLPSRAKMGEKEWYFFCVRDRKYPTGLRTNRATAAGYWKATGKDSAIYRGKCLLGMKKTLVFYGGRAPKGVKSNWVMHEYRLEGEYSRYNLPPKTEAKNEWVICKVFHKISSGKKPDASLLPPSTEKDVRASSTVDSAYVTCFSNATGGHDELLSEYFRSPFPCVPAELRQASPAPLFLPVMSLSSTLCSGTRFPPGAKPISCMTQRDLEISSLMSEDDDEKGRRPLDAQELAPAFTTTVGHPLHVDHCLWNY